MPALGMLLVFPGGSNGKESAYNAGDTSSIPGSGRSSGEENGNPLQYYFLGNAMNRGSWRATVHGVRKRVRHDLATEQQQTDTYSTKSKPSCTQIRKKIFGEVMNPGRNEDYNKGI